MIPSARKFKESQNFDFDKDKALIDYIKKLPNKDELRITDDGRVQIVQA